ncbi:copper chaperone PCu(A)C, partial [Rhizobiaceae bacterium n13]|uniref:copper chaperone PCu(A)C n=1 Tax=Ferirhizobium litorale TaxID=2927786 RepID=UPI0024B2D262
ITRILLAASLALLPLAAAADTAPIEVSDAVARSANPMTAGVYMTLTNTGTAACELAGVTSAQAAKTELHTTSSVDGV